MQILAWRRGILTIVQDTCQAWGHLETMRTCLARLVFPLLLLAAPARASTVDGFITRIDSPTEIEVGTMHVRITSKTSCSFEALSESTRSKPVTPISQCDSTRMKIGSRVTLTGQFTKAGQFVSTHFEMREGFNPKEHLSVMFPFSSSFQV